FTSASVVAATALKSAARAANGASEKLVVGVIGCGGRGLHDALLFKDAPNVEVAWICDVDQGRRNQAAKSLELGSDRVVDDMRRILDQKSIDAVLVATPDHWHSPASILACDAGKHVYVEKPISHNIREGRMLVETAQRNGVQVQHGTQIRSTDMVIQAVKLLHEGLIGNVMVAKVWNVQLRGS